MNWAQTTSPDLIHWHHEPIAISPTPRSPDRKGVFSSSAFLDNGKPTVIYTAVAPPANDSEATLRNGVYTWREMQCLAVAQDDDLRTWKKRPEPVIATPPADSLSPASAIRTSGVKPRTGCSLSALESTTKAG